MTISKEKLHHENKYIISEEQLQYYEELIFNTSVGDDVRSRPLQQELQKERVRVLDEVKSTLLKLQEKFSKEEMRDDIPLKVSQRMGVGRVLMQQVIKVTESLRGEP